MNLDKLNDKQKEAVINTEGPLLILAGAGSGKTTVLVNRIAYMLEEKKVLPYNILAITFTNKAANEMKTRIEKMIGDKAREMWISTFHSSCVRILRSSIERLGFSSNFVIYDSDDSKTVIKECLKELNLDDKMFTPRMIEAKISSAKDSLIGYEEFGVMYNKDYIMSRVAQVYELYQKKLKKNNALDFDDIIFDTVTILKNEPDILEYFQNKFQYIMVDEYQDTSTAQYMLISLLSGGTKNICVVGDDDQSIYKFRGANIRNILDFENDFKNAKVIKLEQNYRSTQKILDAANAVIKNNTKRKSKALWTSNTGGDNIRHYTGYNERDEANFLVEEIEKAVKDGFKYNDFAILYRTNAQSRVIEDAFIRNVIPYRVLSGLRFYDRKEIKDIIAYLRVILNPNDDVSLSRIINEPKRGIGKTTMEKASFLANLHQKSIYEIIRKPEDYPDIIKSSSKLLGFCETIEVLRKIKDSVTIVELIERLLSLTGYMAVLEAEDTVESKTRIENIQEFITVASEFDKNEEDTSFEGFLENITLVSGIDFYDESEDYVVMMTIHSAKGLEFENVFVVGLEEGLFPSLKGPTLDDDSDDVEEERRLCYVALTRAKKKLYITNAQQRTLYGKSSYQLPSRFLKELSSELSHESKRTPIAEVIKQMPDKMRFREVEKENQTFDYLTDFRIGDTVYHKKFGKGVVLNSKKYGKDTLVEVGFETVGPKQLMANFAKLTKE